jgi:S-adenosylmethionine synthetase
MRQKRETRALALESRPASYAIVEATVNTDDSVETGCVFLTVTGTSAEAGDDGEGGRGNRTGGLITPYRAMTLEPLQARESCKSRWETLQSVGWSHCEKDRGRNRKYRRCSVPSCE